MSIEIFYEIAIALSIGMGYLIFIEMFPTKRWETKWSRLAFWLALLIMCIVEMRIVKNVYIFSQGIILFPILEAAILWGFCKCQYQSAFLWMWFYQVAVAVVKFPEMALKKLIYRNDPAALQRDFSVELLWLILVLALIAYLQKKWKQTVYEVLRKVLETERNIIFAFCVLGWSMLTILIYVEQWYISEGLLILEIVMFGMLGLLLERMYRHFKKVEQTRKDFSMQQAVWLREQKTLKDWYAKDAKKMHDIKHIFLYLQKCIEKEEMGKAKDYLKGYIKELEQNQRKIWTGFSEIDFSLNYYYQLMQEQGIEFLIETDIHQIPIAEVDMMIILGNLMDNAMTAAAMCEPGSRYVHLKIQNMNEMFLLQVENTSSEIPKKQGERFLTSKQEKEYHGWGTENVKELVKKYEGEIHYQYTKEHFRVEIIVYSVERK